MLLSSLGLRLYGLSLDVLSDAVRSEVVHVPSELGNLSRDVQSALHWDGRSQLGCLASGCACLVFVDVWSGMLPSGLGLRLFSLSLDDMSSLGLRLFGLSLDVLSGQYNSDRTPKSRPYLQQLTTLRSELGCLV